MAVRNRPLGRSYIPVKRIELVVKLQPGRNRAGNEALRLLSKFLLVITLAKTEDKEAQLMQFLKISVLGPSAGQRRMKKAPERESEDNQELLSFYSMLGIWCAWCLYSSCCCGVNPVKHKLPPITDILYGTAFITRTHAHTYVHTYMLTLTWNRHSQAGKAELDCWIWVHYRSGTASTLANGFFVGVDSAGKSSCEAC